MGRAAWVPDARDMIWIDCTSQVGREMKDVHPFVVLSPRAFNSRTGLVIGFPMTTAQFNDSNPFAIKFVEGVRKTSYILAHQPKSFDWKLRGAKPHPWKQVPGPAFEHARETLAQIIGIAP